MTPGILPSLTAADKFPYLGPAQGVRMVGWDKSRKSLLESIEDHLHDLWHPWGHDDLIRK